MSETAIRVRSYMLKKKQEAAGVEKPLLQRRAEADAMMIQSTKLAESVQTERTDAGGIPALWVRAANVPEGSAKTVLYYHGGGFFSGSAETHKGLATELSAACGMRVLLPDYRLAPEHPCPAAHEDALAAYRWLRASGVAAHDIILGGDSAGAMLALCTMLALRDAGEALPSAAVLLSPWLDILNFDAETYTSRAALDPMVDRESNIRETERYFGPVNQRKALAPLAKDMAGLPPILIQMGDCEVLLGEAQLFANKARAAGVDVQLDVWPEMWHVFQVLTNLLPEAKAAVAKVGAYIANRS